MFLLVIVLVFTIFYLCFKIFINQKSNSVKCLIGKTAIVTGGNSGIGYSTCLLLASRGCRVIIADRNNADKSRDEIIEKTGNPNIFYKYLDLSSLESVRNFSDDIVKTEEKIDILINNAGVGYCVEKRSEDGLNMVMQINYFGAFLLTHLLIKPLRESGAARIIFLSSATMYINRMTSEKLNEWDFGRSVFGHAQNYANSKLCNALAGQEFAKRLKKYNISVYSVDPHSVRTQIFVTSLGVSSSFALLFANIYLFLFGIDSFTGSQTIFHVATSDEIIDKEDTHYAFLRPFFKAPILKNRQFCADVWKETEKLVKLKGNEKL